MTKDFTADGVAVKPTLKNVSLILVSAKSLRTVFRNVDTVAVNHSQN